MANGTLRSEIDQLRREQADGARDSVGRESTLREIADLQQDLLRTRRDVKSLEEEIRISRKREEAAQRTDDRRDDEENRQVRGALQDAYAEFVPSAPVEPTSFDTQLNIILPCGIPVSTPRRPSTARRRRASSPRSSISKPSSHARRRSGPTWRCRRSTSSSSSASSRGSASFSLSRLRASSRTQD
jgi:hypothetical protein